jgi:hypothetical protein
VRRAGPPEGDTAIPKRHPRVLADHEVVQHVDVEEPSGRERLRRQVKVVRRGGGVPRWVVVDQDHARRAPADGVPEELANAHEARAHIALVDRHDAEHDVLRVEQHDSQLLAFEAAHLQHEPVRDVAR